MKVISHKSQNQFALDSEFSTLTTNSSNWCSLMLFITHQIQDFHIHCQHFWWLSLKSLCWIQDQLKFKYSLYRFETHRFLLQWILDSFKPLNQWQSGILISRNHMISNPVLCQVWLENHLNLWPQRHNFDTIPNQPHQLRFLSAIVKLAHLAQWIFQSSRNLRKNYGERCK